MFPIGKEWEKSSIGCEQASLPFSAKMQYNRGSLEKEKEKMAFQMGLIGAGNMGSAILEGAVAKGVAPQTLFVYDSDEKKAEALAQKVGARIGKTQEELEKQCDLLLLAVKPNCINAVLAEMKIPGKAVVSIAAGVDYARLKAHTPVEKRFLRIMPNTPLLVGEGMSVFAQPHTLLPEEYAAVEALFGALGRVEVVSEVQMSAVVGLSGSGPAYIYMLIEAMADAGVKKGLARKTAQMLAAQTVYGSAKMVMETGLHPGELKDMVCSPAGTTIEGVAELETGNFRGVVMRAIEAGADRADNL